VGLLDKVAGEAVGGAKAEGTAMVAAIVHTVGGGGDDAVTLGTGHLAAVLASTPAAIGALTSGVIGLGDVVVSRHCYS
jgi:hypothetical protein